MPSKGTYRAFALSSSLLMGALMAFFVGSPNLYIQILAVSPTEYGLYPPIAITGFIIGGIINQKDLLRVKA